MDAFKSITEKLLESNPKYFAAQLETLTSQEIHDVISSLPEKEVGKLFLHLNNQILINELEKASDEKNSDILSYLGNKEIADIVLNLSEEKRKSLLSKFDTKRKKEVREVLSFPEGSAGRIMSRDYIALKQIVSVKDTVKKLKELSNKVKSLFYVYVLDDERKLVGILHMRDLLVANENDRLSEVMRTDVIKLSPFASREEIVLEFSKRKLSSLPVVENDGRLLGVVRVNLLTNEIQEEMTEDLQKIFGVGSEERPFSPIMAGLKARLPWLHINLLTAFMAAAVVAVFEDVIAQITILAVLLPVVAGQGGNAGAQSLAVVMRGLVMREIPNNKFKKLVLKETILGLLNGLIIGIVTGAITWLWNGNPYLGLVIGLGMIVNLAAAGCSGAFIPLLMKRLGMDPAQSSSIILTTVTDIVGFISFLGFAVLFKEYLV